MALNPIASTIVPRHCVASGLSRMQQDVLSCTSPLAVVSAPTGAGKSRAFVEAIERNEGVLFIVPTRRLAENLVAGIRADLLDRGWSRKDTEEKIVLFTSDQRKADLASGMTSEEISAARKRGLADNLTPTFKGEMIVATPESISWQILSGYRPGSGLGHMSAATIARRFDRIVFDEFHLLDARSFGLACLFAKLATSTEIDTGRARVFFLSATPIDLTEVFQGLGIPATAVVRIDEELVEEGRALHGDVSLELVPGDSLCDLVAANGDLIRDTCAAGEQVLIIYDSLHALKSDKDRMSGILEGLGIARSRILFDNSIDAQKQNSESEGRAHKLEDRDVVIATSTVEVGVTLPRLTVTFMDPGFTPMSLLQRFGRVARGDRNGRVLVRVAEYMRERRPWIRVLEQAVGAVERLEVSDLQAAMARAARFDVHYAVASDQNDDEEEDDARPLAFGSLGTRAVFASSLYYLVVVEQERKAKSNARHAHDLVGKSAPPKTWVIKKLLDDVAAGGAGGRNWAEAFRAEAWILRDIAEGVRIVEDDGRERLEVPIEWLERNTRLLEMFSVQVDKDGKCVLRLPGKIEQFMRERPSWDTSGRTALMTDRSFNCKITRNPVAEWLRNNEKVLRASRSPHERKAAKAAGALVSMTGIVPYLRTEGDADLPLASHTTTL